MTIYHGEQQNNDAKIMQVITAPIACVVALEEPLLTDMWNDCTKGSTFTINHNYIRILAKVGSEL